MVESVTFGSVHVDPDIVLRLQKYRRLEMVPEAVRAVARRMAAEADALVRPEGWIWRGHVRHVDDGGRVLIGLGLEFQSAALARSLEGAVEAAVVLITIGPALERRAHELIGEEHLVEGLLLDTAGWAAIDALLKEVRQQLGAEARARGFRLTARMAPGFDDWGLEQQHVLFSAFEGADLSVRLTDAAVMLPRKSITGLFGLTPLEPTSAA
jgi:hypothetical protein